jgi:hypothetical protein
MILWLNDGQNRKRIKSECQGIKELMTVAISFRRAGVRDAGQLLEGKKNAGASSD